MAVPPDLPELMMTGKIHERIALHSQCVILPKTCPFDLTPAGKISEINTHIVAPRDDAKNAMNAIRHISI